MTLMIAIEKEASVHQMIMRVSGSKCNKFADKTNKIHPIYFSYRINLNKNRLESFCNQKVVGHQRAV